MEITDSDRDGIPVCTTTVIEGDIKINAIYGQACVLQCQSGYSGSAYMECTPNTAVISTEGIEQFPAGCTGECEALYSHLNEVMFLPQVYMYI